MKINPKSFQNVGRSTPYLEWAEDGMLPDEIRSHAIAMLRPYFVDPSILDDLPIEVLGFEAVAVHRVTMDPWCLAMYKGVLSEYRQAYSTDPEASIEAFAAWQPPLLRAQSEFQSLYLLELDKSALDLDEFRVEIFRDIGAILEACVQPQLKALLQQVRVRRSRRTEASTLAGKKFGEIIDELSHSLQNPGLVAPPPWGLKLHIFRNIAQHHSTQLRDEKVVCSYKVGQSNQEVQFGRNELVLVAQKLGHVLGMLRSARTIFYLEHSSLIPGLPAAEAKPSAAIYILTVAAATQGFDVIGFDVTNDLAHLSVRDVTAQDANGRGIHASQLLVQAWILTKSSQIRVTYYDRTGNKRLVADANDIDCEDIAARRTPFEALANRVSFQVFPDQRHR